MLDTSEHITNTADIDLGPAPDPWRLPAGRTQTARDSVENRSPGEHWGLLGKRKPWACQFTDPVRGQRKCHIFN